MMTAKPENEGRQERASEVSFYSWQVVTALAACSVAIEHGNDTGASDALRVSMIALCKVVTLVRPESQGDFDAMMARINAKDTDSHAE